MNQQTAKAYIGGQRAGLMTEREKSLGRYILTLDPIARDRHLARMAPALRQRVRDYALAHRADDLASWNPDVLKLYLDNLFKNRRQEFNDLLSHLPTDKARQYRELIAH